MRAAARRTIQCAAWQSARQTCQDSAAATAGGALSTHSNALPRSSSLYLCRAIASRRANMPSLCKAFSLSSAVGPPSTLISPAVAARHAQFCMAEDGATAPVADAAAADGADEQVSDFTEDLLDALSTDARAFDVRFEGVDGAELVVVGELEEAVLSEGEASRLHWVSLIP